ncbi:MAG: NAD(P)/FAD-dependent oxidoreductase [Burkholderiales bacterium]|jgi:thioredoxin reductase|nr:NAD(P)/FAD-dependent oxidoreductase [Burkholderiales bacterium]
MHDVLILGAGPAGLSAAIELRRAGVRDVVVLEREQTAGGVPRHCGHPGFGWREFRRVLGGPDYARRLVRAADGVDVRTGHTVVRLGRDGVVDVVAPRGPATLQARRVLLALGTREMPRAARLVSGTRPWGVFTTGALQQLVYLAHQRPCTRAVIVGTELVSFSNLMTMRHAGIRPVAMIEPGPRIVAPRVGGVVARLAFGARVHVRTEVVAVHGTHRVEGVEIAHADGTRATLACDGVVFSGRFVPETAIVRPSHVALDPHTGGPRVDQYGRTDDPAIFAAGNLLRPVEASWTAWDEGRRVARAIAASLHGTLPPAASHVALAPVDPVRYACPQQLALPAPLPAALPVNVRVRAPIRGRLRAAIGPRELWRADRLWLPERRTLIPLDAATLGLSADGAPARVDITLESTANHG